MEKLTLQKLKKEIDDLKKNVNSKFELNNNQETPILSSFTEIGTEIDVGKLGKIRLLDTNYNGTGKKIWQFVNVLKPDKVKLGLPDDNNDGGYPSAKGIHESLQEIYDELPMYIKNQIVESIIPCYIPKDKKETKYKTKLFLLSATEMCSNRPYAPIESRPLEFYIRNIPLWNDWQWIRSPYPSYSNYWVRVSVDGTISYYLTYYNGGVAPAFCTD